MLHARKDYDRIQDPAGIIPEDEPVFLIRGKDVCGPDVVLDWCARAFEAGADPEIIEAAKNQAFRMQDYQARFAAKIPDMPEGAGRQ